MYNLGKSDAETKEKLLRSRDKIKTFKKSTYNERKQKIENMQ